MFYDLVKYWTFRFIFTLSRSGLEVKAMSQSRSHWRRNGDNMVAVTWNEGFLVLTEADLLVLGFALCVL